MGNIYNIINNLNNIPREDIRRNLSELVEKAHEDSNYFLFGFLVDNGFEDFPHKGWKLELYERYCADKKFNCESTLEQKTLFPERVKSYDERKGTFIPSTSGGLKDGIGILCGMLGDKPPKCLYKMKKEERKRYYWRLRIEAEKRGLL